jgi:hypothetical protein
MKETVKYIVSTLRGRAPAIAALLAVAGMIAPLEAQGQGSLAFPQGEPAVLLPVQSSSPLPDGSWPLGVRNENEAQAAFDAELEFAFRERPDVELWVLPEQVATRLRRNPMLGVDAYRLAYRGLLKKPDSREQIYEPLHTQLRQIAALFETRYLVLPVVGWVEEVEEDDDEPEEGAEPLPDGAVEAKIRVAMIDIRMSKVLWYGEMRGEPTDPDAPDLVASMAARVAAFLVP